MKKLCYNAKAALYRVGGEYWYVTVELKHGCYNSYSETYKAKQALESFEKDFGPVDPATKHRNFDWL